MKLSVGYILLEFGVSALFVWAFNVLPLSRAEL